jgi:mannitol/fructose-specific phosphotransferase system IIA component (Ntr-type)
MSSHIIKFSSIFIPVNASDKDQVMKSVAWVIDRDPQFQKTVTDKICDSVWLNDHFQKNEFENPSSVDNGFVILNVTSGLVAEPYLALLRLTDPVLWGNIETQPIDIVAVIISPCAVSSFDVGYDRDKGLHLQRLSRMTRFLMNDENINGIHAANSVNDLADWLVVTEPVSQKQAA